MIDPVLKFIAIPRRSIACKLCSKIAHYNYPMNSMGMYCKNHMSTGMVNVWNRLCVNCQAKTPTYNYKQTGPRILCTDCKFDGMVINVKRSCIVCRKVRASYNYRGELKCTHCISCSLPGMIQLTSRMCKMCNYRASYNYSGLKIPIYCSKCALPDMIDISHALCVTCHKKRASHNTVGKKDPLYCFGCASPEMRNVTNKLCACGLRSSFNYPGKKIPTHCSVCADIGMIDVVKRRCYACNTQASYGYCGQSVESCVTHKKQAMYKRPRRSCIAEDCKEIASYGLNSPEYCIIHAPDSARCLVVKKCSKCDRNDELLDRDNLCINYCSKQQRYEGDKKYTKKKEKMVLDHLTKYINTSNVFNVVDDKIADAKCSHRRPDRVYDCGTHIIIVEIDENAHRGKSYNCMGESTEKARMVEIQQSFGMNCVFIRYNPDSFKVNGKPVKIHTTSRLKILERWVNYFITQYKPTTNIEKVKYIKLFFDEFDVDNVNIESVCGINIVNGQSVYNVNL